MCPAGLAAGAAAPRRARRATDAALPNEAAPGRRLTAAELTPHVRLERREDPGGAATGALFLGVDGRVARDAFALATARSAGFTLRGSLNVVFTGAIAGAIGGVLLAVIERFLPQRLWLRECC